ncbi:MAG: sigma-70 family RNA polymerase sigma factor [Isosphaeraceae bacterium]
MSESLDDQGLVAACRAGQSEAYGHLVRRYQDRLYPTVLRLTGCAEDAQDLIQEAFLKGYEKLSLFQGDSSFYTWIYRIAVNLALSGRRRKRPWLRLAEAFRGGPIDPPQDPIESDPALPLELAEREHLIQAALDALAPDHRAVIVMKEYDGLRYEEIAAILGVPVGTIRSRLHRARCDLRERLRPLVDEELRVTTPGHSNTTPASEPTPVTPLPCPG